MTKKLLQQALEALENSSSFIFVDVIKAHLRDDAIAALKSAIAQPVAQRVVAWMTEDGRVATDVTKQGSMSTSSKVVFNIPLYTSQAIAQPEQPASHNLQKRLENLHLYEEINEHYAKCNPGPGHLRDWVVDRMGAQPAAKLEPAQPESKP